MSKPLTPMEKLRKITKGETVTLTLGERDLLRPFDVYNIIRSRTLVECWIDKKDLSRFKDL